MITKARRSLDKESLTTLYYPLIYPYLCCCHHVLGNAVMSYFNKLYKMQKKIVRIIAGFRPRTHSMHLIKKCEILNIVEINKYPIVRFMYHLHNKCMVAMFITILSLNKDVHGHNTNVIIIIYHRCIKSKSYLPYRGAILRDIILNCGINTNEMEHTFL